MADVTNLREKLGAARLEEDDFVINDIPLKIPPQQISVNKQSYINKWDGLRLGFPQKTKSGHGIASVSFSTIFVGNVAINETLRPVVAGLRSTPFCVIHNKYLFDCFREISGNNEETIYPYKKLQPIVLALTSMSFSTVPGRPDCINGRFDFIWFNYLPYTPIWAYKTGKTFDAPGPVYESELWKYFYLPYLSDMKKVSWPHLQPKTEGRTIFRWRDYTIRSVSDSSIDQQTADIITAIERSPDRALSSWKSIVSSLDTTSQDVYDRYWNSLVQQGIIDNREAKAIKDVNAGKYTSQSQNILKPLMKKLTPQFFHGLKSARAAVNENKAYIQSSLAELNRRITQTKQIEEKNNEFDPSGWELVDQYKMRIKFRDQTGNEIDNGGLNIYTKERAKAIGPRSRVGLNSGVVINGMSITFSTSLSVIPMIGHSYPTCQFCGGYDVNYDITVNGPNSEVNQLQQTYDRWNKTNLRFRMIPQGFRNIKIENDFAELFGISEWLPVSVDATTIPDQPGRTQAILSFTHAGITSNTKLDDPEELTQEYVGGDRKVYEAIWNKFQRYFGPHPIDYDGKYTIAKFKPYKKSEEAFYDLLNEAIENYNEVITKIVKLIFSHSIFTGKNKKTFRGGIGSSGLEYYSVFSRMTSSNLLRGFIPGLKRMQRVIEQMKRTGDDYAKQPLLRSLGSTRKAIQAREVQREYTTLPGDDPQKQKFERGNELQYQSSSLEQVERNIQVKINELGIQEYQQKMNDLFTRIINNYSNLIQFKDIVPLIEREGLNKGKPAYPDFKRSLSSVGSFLDASFTSNKLIDYDPDIYLWYPSYNGSLASSDLIDTTLLNQAKQHSRKIYEGAFEATSKYFKEKYMKDLTDYSNPAPKKALEQFSGGELARELYKEVSYKNSTKEPAEGGINLTVVPDSGKTPSNFYTEKNPRIESISDITHSTFIDDLWDGMVPEVGSSTQPNINPKKGIQPEVGTVSAPPIRGTNLGIEDRSFEFSWPPKKSAQSPNEFGCVSPVESYRATCGIMPRPCDATRFSFEAYRRNAVVAHWASGEYARSKLRAAGFTDPNLASKQLALISKKSRVPKPVNKWTFDDYIEWKNAGRNRRMGYLHTGTDFFNDVGTDVYAVADGYVKYKAPRPVKGAGLFIEIVHPNGKNFQLSRYLHLQAISPKIKKGTQVKAGDRIAVMGRSGYKKTRPHLHFEVWRTKNIPKGVSHLRYGELINSQVYSESGIPLKKGTYSGRKKLSEKDAQRYSRLANQSLDKGAMSTPTSPIKRAIDEFEMSLIKGQGQRLTRAYPTYKLYFIEDDSNQRKRLAFDDFFSYNSVQSIRVTKSRKIAADLCVIELTNISGTLSNRKFRTETYSKEFGDQSGKPRDNKGQILDENRALDAPMLANTKDENPIASLLLQEGINIHLKLGFSNDPDLLDPVFTGKIQAINFSDTDDMVTIVAQSYATELVQDIKGVEDPKTSSSFGLFGWTAFGWNGGATTGKIIEEMLAQPEMIHFGRWERGDSTANRSLLTNKFQFVANPADDNIFAPPPSEDMDLASGFIFKDISYTIYRTTVWDILKEMELRHPNFIGSPVPYKDKYSERMTYFFGLPNQLYFARNPTPEEQQVQDKMRKQEEEAQEKLRKEIEKDLKLKVLFDKLKPSVGDTWVDRAVNKGLRSPFLKEGTSATEAAWKFLYNNVLGSRLNEQINAIYRKKRLRIAKEQGFIAPFRKYHLYTSGNHIVANNIKADARDTANTVIIKYLNNTTRFENKTKLKFHIGLPFETERKTNALTESFIMKLDNALPTEDMRVQVCDCINVNNPDLAKNYALSILAQNVKDIYKGDLVVIGDPSVKPYDQIFLLDSYSDMTGCVEVEQVTHVFTKDQGFLTEIKPDMVCAVSEYSLLSTSEALGIIMEGVIKKMFGSNQQTAKSSYTTGTLSVWAQALGSSAAFFGGFLAKKIINYTQTGHPIITCPLLYHGRELSGGIPTRKLPGSIWETVFGEWKDKSSGDLSYHSWSDDLYDNIMKTIKKSTGGYSTGTLSGWGHNTLDT